MSSVGSVRDFFETQLPERLRAHPELGTQLGRLIQFEISGPEGGDWFLDARSAPFTVSSGRAPSPTCTVACGQEDFALMLEHRLTPRAAFAAGKLRVKGDVTTAMRLAALFPSQPSP